MLRLLLAIIALLACCYAMYTDFKYRYIDNWLTISLVVVGLIGHVALSIYEGSLTPILYSLCGVVIFFAIANIFFYTGTFGGGDVKLLMGFAAMIPTYPLRLFAYFTPELSGWPFMLSLLLNVLLIGTIYSLCFMIVKAFSRKKLFWPEFKSKIYKNKNWFYFGAALVLIPIILFVISKPLWIIGVAALLFYWFIIMTFFFSQSMEKVMTYYARPSQLEAGDQPVSKIKVNGKTVYRPRLIGLIESDIKKLKALEKLGELDKIKVRDGIPYAPALFLGLLASLVFGDLLWLIIKSAFN